MGLDPNKRRNVRFTPDPGTVARLDKRSSSAERSFDPTISALVQNESYTGCALVALSTDELKPGDMLTVQVGQLAPIGAQIVWRADLDSDIIRLGLQYL